MSALLTGYRGGFRATEPDGCGLLVGIGIVAKAVHEVAFIVVCPAAAAHDFVRARWRAGGILAGTEAIVISFVPVVSPFPNIPSHIEKSIAVRRQGPDSRCAERIIGMGLISGFVRGARFGGFIATHTESCFSPWKLGPIQTAARRLLPFCFGRQAFPDGFAIRIGIEPCHVVNRIPLLTLRDFAGGPLPRFRALRRVRNASVLFVAHLVLVQVKGVDRNLVRRCSVLAIALIPADGVNKEEACPPHPEFTRWNQRHVAWSVLGEEWHCYQKAQETQSRK